MTEETTDRWLTIGRIVGVLLIVFAVWLVSHPMLHPEHAGAPHWLSAGVLGFGGCLAFPERTAAAARHAVEFLPWKK